MTDAFVVTPAPPDPVPQLPPQTQQSNQLKIFVAVVSVVILVGGGVLIYNRFIGSSQPVAPTPTPLPAVTAPTPVRRLSAVATQSAFLILDAHVASLSASIANYSAEDPTLAVPVLEIPLPIPERP